MIFACDFFVISWKVYEEKISDAPPWEWYLVYLCDGDVPLFRVSFSPPFSWEGYQRKAVFLEPVVKTYRKGKFC